MKQIFPILLFSCMVSLASAQRITGRVLSADQGSPVPAASIHFKRAGITAIADSAGRFSVLLSTLPDTALVSSVGYIVKKVPISNTGPFTVQLSPDVRQLKDVTVSNGYQDISAQRATGSFVQIGQELLNRRISTDILARLEDVTPGLIFNRGATATGKPISIRGQSTIFANTQPLIVIDNFPYEGDIANINPNDVESITVLKDAAAAAIWGSRAGNGVIVITTKKGRAGAPTVSFSANITAGQKPNLFYMPVMSSADFIDIEKTLFAQGFYKSTETAANNRALTPVVELLIAKRDGKLPAAEADARIEALKQNDVRNDFSKYLYRPSLSQQTALALSGGTALQQYYVSLGYSKDLASLRRNDYSRFSLDARNNYTLLNKKLEIGTSLYASRSSTANNNPGTAIASLLASSVNTLYPYASLADPDGNPLSITRDYRDAFSQSAVQKGLLNWEYRPLDELEFADNSSTSKDYRFGASLKYKIINPLHVSLLYQRGGNISDSRKLQDQRTWFTRNTINNYSQPGTTAGSFTYPVPLGSIADISNLEVASDQLRAQLNFNKVLGLHQLSAIAGVEQRSQTSTAANYRLYGYDVEHAIGSKVDYVTTFAQFSNPTSKIAIPNVDAQSELTDRNRSYYATATYSFRDKYMVTSSARLDQSNLFGVSTNQKGVPLYSAGIAWIASNEPFLKLPWLQYLKARLTWGYNGNIDKTLSAYTTARFTEARLSLINALSARVVNPPNPELRWERVKVLNLGLDYQLLASRLSGSLDLYQKNGIDLIGSTPFQPSTGILVFKGNTADTRTRGIDFVLNSDNLTGQLKWQSNFMYSFNKDIVTGYKIKETGRTYAGSLSTPLEGKPLYGVYSYPWAGLDPATGDPQGYLNGQVSKDYAAIINGALPESLTYHGSARPVSYGAFRNTVSFHNFSLSANVSYRLGYWYRSSNINYAVILSGTGYAYGEYPDRWQKPGDEAITSVPSLPAISNANRDTFYGNSAVRVHRGDHIRFQDINFSYNLLPAKKGLLPFRRMLFTVYANNLGLIWKADKSGLDPDYTSQFSIPPSRTIAAGIQADF